MPEPEVHVLIPTHTPRHLGVCLAGLAWQTKLPSSVVVTCDTDDPAIARLLDEVWPRIVAAARSRHHAWEGRLVHTFRPHQGEARPAQARNNGLRALERWMRSDDLVVGIDGDIVLAPTALAAHANRIERGAEVNLGQRVCLDERQTRMLDLDSVLGGGIDLEGLERPEEVRALSARHAKFERILWWKRVLPRGVSRLLIRSHKPKLMSAHYAVTVRRLREVNGFDEEYTGYGYEDDDLGRRLHAVGARVSVAIADIRAYHLWHPTRLPADRTQTPEYRRFARMDLPAFAVHGWWNPVAQPEPVVRVVAAAV